MEKTMQQMTFGCQTRAAMLCLGGVIVASALAPQPFFSNAEGSKATVPEAHAPTSVLTLALDLPYDVDVDALAKLDRDNQVPEAQRLFDVFAWQTFVALNWPAKEDGSPDAAKNMKDGSSKRVWESWRRNDTIFLPNGEKPDPWNPKRDLAEERYLWRFSKMLDEHRSPENAFTDFIQAFTGPLVDQNGVFVRYESYLNKTQFDYVFENELYNQEGQVQFVSAKGNKIEFPANKTTPVKRYGSMGIKLAWKQLGDDDIPGRFFTRKAIVVSTSFDKDGRPVRHKSEKLMGLVGMHITALTQSSPNWIWTTFEHIDNVAANDLDFGTTRKGESRRVRPNFNNPDAPTKLVNLLPPHNAPPGEPKKFSTWDESKTTNPTQLTRVVPIAPATQELNRAVQALLREQGSVFQYYELVGAQWPVQPGFPAFAGGAKSAPESIVFKTPGRVVPVYLVNTVMESYFQTGAQAAGPLAEDDRLPVGMFADNRSEAVTADRTKVFGTESCVGCHYSAGAVVAFKRDENGKLMHDPDTGLKIPVYGERGNFGQNGNSHYFWQMQLKARQKEPPAK
jgi:mono/diheme cytochrome c family protein